MLQQIGDTVGSVIALATAGDGGKKELKEAVALIKAVQSPDFDYSSLTAPQLALIAEYDPVTYDSYLPDDVKVAHDSPELRASLQKGIERYNKIAEEGLPLQTRLATENAQSAMEQENKRLRDAAMSDLAARGRLGSGEEFAMKAIAGSQDANLARALANDLAAQEIGVRQDAMAQGANLAQSVRAQDWSQQQDTANTVNNFARWLSEMKTQENAANAAEKQRAQAANIQRRQGVADANTMNKYGTALSNLTRRNALEQDRAQFDLSKAAAAGTALTNLSKRKDAEQAARTEAIRGIGAGVGSIGDTVVSAYTGGLSGLAGGGLFGDTASKKKYSAWV